MMFYTPHELQLYAQGKIKEYEKQTELERLLKEAGTLPPLRSQLARLLQQLVVKLAPELSHPEPARSLKPPRKTSAQRDQHLQRSYEPDSEHLNL